MTVVYSNTIKDARMNDALTGIDNNAAHATLEICTAAYAAVLVIITLAKPSFSEASQALTLLGVPVSGTAGATGTAAAARIKDGGGGVQVNNLSVGTAGSDINLSSTSITSGQTVSITAGTITHG
jgi:hypothetical protein